MSREAMIESMEVCFTGVEDLVYGYEAAVKEAIRCNSPEVERGARIVMEYIGCSPDASQVVREEMLRLKRREDE